MTARRAGAVLMPALLAVLTGVSTTAAAPVGPTWRAAPAASAHTFAGSRRVGPVFFPGFAGLHICTASVIRSRHHDVIMTAAHCLNSGGGAGYAFAPGYHDGTAPYGVWHTTAAYAAKRWVTRDGDQRRDFVFLTVAPRQVGGRLRQIQDVVGGYRLGWRAKRHEHVRITGYPLGVGGSPLTCKTHVFLHRGYPGTRCHGFGDGTSGGPWSTIRGPHRVVGLISGLHQGGCTPAVTYSSPLGRPAHTVLHRAERRRHPDAMPQRPGDGC